MEALNILLSGNCSLLKEGELRLNFPIFDSFAVISGQTIQFFGRNAETETALVEKTKILAETEILAESFVLAKRHCFGRNTLFWPQNTLFWPKQMFRTKTRE